jgi:hypothetical protein
MRTLHRFRHLLSLAGAAASLCTLSVRAAGADASVPVPLPSVSDDTPLVIANGVLRDYLVDGKPARATLGNLVPIVQRHYPASNITMIGVDDIIVGDLVLQWAPKVSVPNLPPRPPPLNLVLLALTEASGRKFRASDNQDSSTFLLVKYDDPGVLGPRVADVVYIGNILNHEIDKKKIQENINYFQDHVSSLVGNIPEKEFLLKEIAALKEQLEQDPSDEEINKLLAQISEMVTEALNKLQPDAKPPEFQFHKGTDLLVVIGSASAVDITRKVVAALEQAQ